MDFTVDKSILNFITPPPPKLESMEDKRDYRMTIPQMQSMLEEFVRIEGFREGDSRLPNHLLSNMLMNKINYSRNFGGYVNAMPKNWQFIDLCAI